jgi:hypothetical protein
MDMRIRRNTKICEEENTECAGDLPQLLHGIDSLVLRFTSWKLRTRSHTTFSNRVQLPHSIALFR